MSVTQKFMGRFSNLHKIGLKDKKTKISFSFKGCSDRVKFPISPQAMERKKAMWSTDSNTGLFDYSWYKRKLGVSWEYTGAIYPEVLYKIDEYIGRENMWHLLAFMGEVLLCAHDKHLLHMFHMTDEQFSALFDNMSEWKQWTAWIQEQCDQVEMIAEKADGKYLFKGFDVKFGVGKNYSDAYDDALGIDRGGTKFRLACIQIGGKYYYPDGTVKEPSTTEEPMTNQIENELWKAYESTKFTVETPDGEIIIRANKTNPELDKFLEANNVVLWAFITAENPGSVPLSDRQNMERMSEFANKLKGLAYTIFPGKGLGEDASWTPERSYLIFNISEPEAIRLGQQYGQNAILCGERDGESRLVDCSNDS